MPILNDEGSAPISPFYQYLKGQKFAVYARKAEGAANCQLVLEIQLHTPCVTFLIAPQILCSRVWPCGDLLFTLITHGGQARPEKLHP